MYDLTEHEWVRREVEGLSGASAEFRRLPESEAKALDKVDLNDSASWDRALEILGSAIRNVEGIAKDGESLTTWEQVQEHAPRLVLARFLGSFHVAQWSEEDAGN